MDFVVPISFFSGYVMVPMFFARTIVLQCFFYMLVSCGCHHAGTFSKKYQMLSFSEVLIKK